MVEIEVWHWETSAAVPVLNMRIDGKEVVAEISKSNVVEDGTIRVRGKVFGGGPTFTAHLAPSGLPADGSTGTLKYM